MLESAPQWGKRPKGGGDSSARQGVLAVLQEWHGHSRQVKQGDHTQEAWSSSQREGAGATCGTLWALAGLWVRLGDSEQRGHTRTPLAAVLEKD